MDSHEEVSAIDTELMEDLFPNRKWRLTSFLAEDIIFNIDEAIDEQDICRQEEDEVDHKNSQKCRCNLFFAIQLS